MDYTILYRARGAQSALSVTQKFLQNASPEETAVFKQRVKDQQDTFSRLFREALQFIDTVNDPGIRDILLLRCLKGLPWREVAANMDGDLSTDAVKQRFTRWKKAHSAMR